MKKIFTVAAMLLAAMAATAQEKGVGFFGGTLEEALAKAGVENKRVFIDFYTDWCGPCKAVAKYVFPTDEAGEYFNARFVSLTADAEKGMGVELADKFDIQSFPTFIVLDAGGGVLARWSGGSSRPTPAGFIEKLEQQLAAGPDGDPQEAMMRRMMAEQAADKPRPEAVEKPGVHEFVGTYAEALALAKAGGRMVFVDCYTQWCGPCKLMSAQVFPREEVGDYMNPRFVFMKLDMEAGEGPELNKIFKVRAYPTYVILDGNGNEVSRFDGYMAADAFIAKIGSIIDKDKTPEAMQARYDAGERDKTFLRDYIGMLSGQRRTEEAFAAAKELMDGLTDAEKMEAAYWPYWTNYGYSGPAENFGFLVENQYKFAVGKKVVTDFLVDVARGRYGEIAFDYDALRGDAPSAGEMKERLAGADALAERLELETNPTVRLYRAAAEAKISGNADGLIAAYGTYANTVFGEPEQDAFLQNVFFFFGNDLTQEQRERFASLAKGERIKSMFSSGGGVRMLRNGVPVE